MMPLEDTKEVFYISQYFEIKPRALIEAKGEGIYTWHSLLNHSCAPNAVIVNPIEGNLDKSALILQFQIQGLLYKPYNLFLRVRK
jgi:hypothetical protein